LHTSGGQIIPTAAAREADSETSTKTSPNDVSQTNTEEKSAGSTSTVSEGRAVETGKVESHMVIGVLGAVAVAAVL
jgi:hypothetical protein